MAKTTQGDLASVVSAALNKPFNLEQFRKSKYLDKNIGFKSQKWIPLSPAIQEALSIPGIAMGHITLLRGHSDTGKTTALLEAAISAQKMGVLPIFIITEMKWSWEHAKQMGFQINEDVDTATGEINYSGHFLYADRSSLTTVEDVASFMADLLNEQAKGNLPYDLLFLWDSVGSIPCKMSVEKESNNNEWNAGAMSTQFGNFINQRFPLSRKQNSPYTNTFLCVNKIWVAKAENAMSQPKMKNKGGETMFFDASMILTFGNITNSGTSKHKATKNGKEVEFAKRTKVSCDKNHVNGITTKSTITATVHGFIPDDKTAIDEYKKAHKKEWLQVLGSTDFDLIEDNSEWNETKDIPLGIEIDTDIDE